MMYLWQCIRCKKYLYSENIVAQHCNKLVQWINGIEGKGVNMTSPIVKIKVSGYISMTQENFDQLMKGKDPHLSLVYAIHCGYVDSTELIFEEE